MIGVRKHLNSSVVFGDSKEDLIYVSPNSYVVARTIHMVGRDILLFICYCKNGDLGLCMEYIAEKTKNGKLPYIAFGDFNLSAKDTRQSLWVERMDAKVMTAEGRAVTCFLKGGTCIDYIVCSPYVAPYILALERELGVPWSPHYGLRQYNPRRCFRSQGTPGTPIRPSS